MKDIRVFSVIIPVMVIFSTCIEQISGQEKQRFTAGIGFAETLNAGVRFRVKEKSQIGFSIGTWPSPPNDWLFNWKCLISLSGDYYYHFGKQLEYSNLSPWYIRTGLDYFRIGYGASHENNMEIHFRFGRDIYFSESSGISLDAGVGTLLINETGFTQVLPVAGFSFFFTF